MLELQLTEHGDIQEGVFSPGKKVLLVAYVQNVGGLTFPKGASLTISAHDFFPKPITFTLPSLSAGKQHQEVIESQVRLYFAHGDTLQATGEISIPNVYHRWKFGRIVRRITASRKNHV